MHRVVVWLAGLALGAAALAQAPDAPVPAPTAPGMSSEQLPEPATPGPTTPRRRRTRTPTATSTATALDTATATAVPPTRTSTQPPVPTATLAPMPAGASASTPMPALSSLALANGSTSGPLTLVLGGALALFAIWLGARIARAHERTERRRARRTLATAMLVELRRLDAVLRRVVALDNPASFPSLDHPIMEAALRDLTLFQTETAARIAQFHGALRGIQHDIGDYRDNPLRWAGRLAELNQLIKGRAAAACRAVPALLKALENEGGAPPPHLPEPPSSASSAPSGLPPPPFGAGEGDDWTL